ncbi:MAG: hypothetical protein ACE367_03785 [Acidimicrobiales bacterium]
MASAAALSGEARHLVMRFVWSLRVEAPDEADEAMLVALLSPEELALYQAQPLADRAHSVACAVAIRNDPTVRPTRDLLVASALHDVGKADTALGTPGRVAATLFGVVVGRRRTARWLEWRGPVGRMARYRHHDERGARMLEAAGSSPLVVAWALEHHLEADQRSIEAHLAAALRRADEAAA